MKKARLLKLANILEEDANNPKGAKFDLGTWGASKTETMSLSCGTQACAMGVAALSGKFKSAGLTWGAEPDTVPCDDVDCELCDNNVIAYEMSIECNGHHGMNAAVELFDISDTEASYLFYPDNYPETQRRGKRGEMAVVKRIRALVANGRHPEIVAGVGF